MRPVNRSPKLAVGLVMLTLAVVAAIGRFRQTSEHRTDLPAARRGFVTHLRPGNEERQPVDTPPPALFSVVKYQSAVGALPAYLSPDPKDGKKHPAIVWITGGDCNSIGDVWTPETPDNDQTAAAYRKAGIIMMFPSLRGGNQNPGLKEGFLREVDDVERAGAHLSTLKYVDPHRIYLGGHSTGGTLSLLTAECTPAFRAVFSFGPVADVSTYAADSGFCPFDTSDRQEVLLRSPGYWLGSIRTPVWVFEGVQQGNIRSLRKMAGLPNSGLARFIEIENATHFSTLAPTNALIAEKIVQDTGPSCGITITSDEVNRNYDEEVGSRR